MPGADGPVPIRLSASVDTLEALRLGKRLRDAAVQSRHLRVDASAVEEIGLAGLQLFALIKAILAEGGGELVFADPSPALRARMADAGLEPLLLDSSVQYPDPAWPRHSLTFTDAALDYGREPVEALRRLRDAGISVAPILPDALPAMEAVEADHLILRFEVHLPSDAAAAVLADALAEFGGDAQIDAPSSAREAAPAQAEQPTAAPSDPQAIKVERLMADVEELMMRHAAITAHAASLDRDLVAELKAMGDALRSLQDRAIAVGLAPLGLLLQRTAEEADRRSFAGSDIEIEPGVIAPVMPMLAPLLARTAPNSLSAEEIKGVLTIDIASASMPAGLETAVLSVRGRATIVSKDSGPVLRLELPRSRAMLEALIVGAGAQMGAIPVDRAIEILRPEPADLASVGSGSQLMRFRGSYLPLVDLTSALARGMAPDEAEATIVVVVQSDAGNFGIRVREVTDHRQIMVKPLDDTIPAGAGVVGLSFSAGGIVLVLDVDALRLATLGAGRQA